MEILSSIKDLLLLHDCVIIPGFGGFVTNYQAAKIHNSNFNPPAKAISFNNKLKFNDGLFVNYIADLQGLNYVAASKKVNLLVQELNYRLSDGERVVIEQLGELYYNDGDHLIFEQAAGLNLNLESYGLESFQFETLYAKKLARSVSKREKDAVEVIFQNRSLKKLMIGLPLVLALAFFPIKDNKEIVQKSDLSILTEMTSPAEPAQKVEQIDIPVVIEKTTENQYFLIGGSFRSQANAKRFLKLKKKEGFDAQNLGLIKGLNYIALGGFPDFEGAKAKQLEIRKHSSGSDIWIYVKK